MKTKTTQKEEEGERYSEMSIEKLNEEIKEERFFAKNQGASEYTIRELEASKEHVEMYNKRIAAKKAELLEEVKELKEYQKEAKKVLKELEAQKEGDEKFKQSRLRFVERLEMIKANLEKDPNFYKEEDK